MNANGEPIVPMPAASATVTADVTDESLAAAPRPEWARALGCYRLGRELGRGGMGVVYLGEHLTLGKRVAVKVHHSSEEGSLARARFAREARIASSLRHPHIAEVYDYGRDHGVDYIVMELAEGGTLATFGAKKTLPLRDAVDLFLPIASAVEHAHVHGVVHRDLKPANVLLAVDRFGQLAPKVTDFGIGKSASLEDERLTDDGRLLGTLSYMPPEQVRDVKAVRAAADQYALAAMLYEAVTGELPYRAESTLDWMHAILRGGAPPPSRLNPSLPPPFDEVVLRALAVREESRFSSVRAFGQALLPFASARAWAIWARELGLDRTAGDTADGDSSASVPNLARIERGQRGSRWVQWLTHAAVGAFCTTCTLAATRWSRPPTPPHASGITRAFGAHAMLMMPRDTLRPDPADVRDAAAPHGSIAASTPSAPRRASTRELLTPPVASTGPQFGINRAPIIE